MNCPYCKSESLQSRGTKENKNGDIKRSYYCNDCGKWFSDFDDVEIITQNVQLAKGKQKQQDINRIERKSFREFARLDNALLESNEKLIETIKNNPFKITLQTHKQTKENIALIVHLSDLHFNELVNLPNNKYDFKIAAKRLQKLAEKTKLKAKIYNIKTIFIAITGDLMNSDRRLDEMLNQATNRNNATYLSYLLLSQFIIDLNQIANISIAVVSGNESRVKEEKGYSDIVATDNYDFTIFNMLKVKFENKIVFIDGDPSELVVRVGNVNVLLLHGEGLEVDTQKRIQQIIGKYSLRGIEIGFVLYGHVHSPYITDFSARSGGMVGSNDYNEKALFLVSRASQNLHLVFPDKSIDSTKVDLQNTDNCEGYKIINALESYNAKSAKKLHHKQIIHQIVI